MSNWKLYLYYMLVHSVFHPFLLLLPVFVLTGGSFLGVVLFFAYAGLWIAFRAMNKELENKAIDMMKL